MSKAIKTLALAVIIAASASGAVAQTPPYYAEPHQDYSRPEYPAAPYGYASPSYRSQYGTYPAPPAHTYDPYRRNRGADFPDR